MKRVAKQFIGYLQIAVRRGHVVLLFILPLCGVLALALQNPAVSNAALPPQNRISDQLGAPLARDPIFVYNNWSAYDELSDNIPLTEHLALKELDEVLRLRRFGVRFDYYMMDAFWFDPDGGYRTWRKPNWPDGPDAWIKKCRDNGILPGLWFGTNALVKINPAPAWQDSLTEKKGSMSFSEGGFFPTLWIHCSTGTTMASACSSLILRILTPPLQPSRKPSHANRFMPAMSMPFVKR